MPLIDCVALNRHSSALHDGAAAPRSEGRRAAVSLHPHALPTSCCKASACMLCGYLPFKSVASRTEKLSRVRMQHLRFVCRYAFWDIYGDIGLPGGIPLHSFAETWTRHCLSFDANDLSR